MQLDRAPAWMARGSCVGSSPELFFSGPTENGSTMAAKRACDGCPVAEQCLAYAMDNQITYGVWGGKSEKQRKALRKSWGLNGRGPGRHLAEHGTDARYQAGCTCVDCKAAHVLANRLNDERRRRESA